MNLGLGHMEQSRSDLTLPFDLHNLVGSRRRPHWVSYGDSWCVWSEEVVSLPGYGAPPTAHHSGFVEVDTSTGINLGVVPDSIRFCNRCDQFAIQMSSWTTLPWHG